MSSRFSLWSYLPAPVTDFFSRGAARSIKAKRNILYSFFLKGFSILISFLLVPLTIHYVNPTRYGVWVTLSSVVMWLGFFDIGLGNGFRNRFAEALAKGQYKLARVYVSTTYAVLAIIMGLVVLVLAAVNPFVEWSTVLNTSPDMEHELKALALVVILLFAVQFVLQVITTVMTANQQPARASLINFLGNVVALLLMTLLMYTHPGDLLLMGLALAVSPVLVMLLASVWFYRGEYRRFAPSWRYVNFRFTGQLMHLGVQFFVIQVSALILFQTSNIIISQILGPAYVTPYNIAFKYFGAAQMLFVIILSPFWSAFTEAYVKDDIPWIKSITRKLTRVWLLLVVLVAVMLLISPYVYNHWVGSSVYVPFSLSVASALYVIIICWSSIFVNFVNGVGKVRLQLYFSVLIALVNIPLSLFLARDCGMGMTGLVYANSICLAAGAVLTTYQYYQVVHRKAKGIWDK